MHLALGPEKRFRNLLYIRVSRKLFIFSIHQLYIYVFNTNRVRGPSVSDGPIFFRLDLWPMHLALGPEKRFRNLLYIRVSRKLFIFSKFKLRL